jgi:protein-disulfide isomerase
VNTDETVLDLTAPVTGRDHVQGPSDARVVLVEYGDYECPDCGRTYWVTKQLLEELGPEVAFVFRNFPVVEAHPRAESVAEALEVAAGQGRFWELHDWFYEHQHALDRVDLESHAQLMGLDMDSWRNDLREGTYRSRVREDLESGRASGVTGTPTFFINGTRYQGGHDLDSMLAAVRAAIETTLN